MPHDTPFTDKAVASELNNDGMTWARSSEVSTYDSTARDDGFAAKNDVLWTCDGSSTRDFVTRVLNSAVVRSSTLARVQ